MNKKSTEAVVNILRPYAALETSMVKSIRAGLVKAMETIPFTGNSLEVHIKKATYLMEIRDLENELTLRN